MKKRMHCITICCLTVLFACITLVGCFGSQPSNWKGEFMNFGSYPQSRVNNSVLQKTLNSLAGTLPTSEDSQSWTSYEYYLEYDKADYMWYIDLTHEGEKYRGVYFTTYRPGWVGADGREILSEQPRNGYIVETVYWFRYEPIRWCVLEQKDGKAFLLSDRLLDAQEYYELSKNRIEGEKEIYPSNYEYSSIRSWLNGTFYQTAFSAAEREKIALTTVKNDEESMKDTVGILDAAPEYLCADTQDYVFLLSEREVTTPQYGFNKGYSKLDQARRKYTSQYARSQGAICYDDSSKISNWWLRSPSSRKESLVRYVSNLGATSFNYTYYMRSGVCPAIWVNL